MKILILWPEKQNVNKRHAVTNCPILGNWAAHSKKAYFAEYSSTRRVRRPSTRVQKFCTRDTTSPNTFFQIQIQIQIRLFEIFQIQIQIQIRAAEIFQIQIQIQIRLAEIFQIQIQIRLLEIFQIQIQIQIWLVQIQIQIQIRLVEIFQIQIQIQMLISVTMPTSNYVVVECHFRPEGSPLEI